MGYRLLKLIGVVGMMGMMMGCNNDVPVIEVPQAKSSSEPDLIKTNRMIAQRENSEIENFAARRNWKMTDIGSGIKVMKTREGHGPVADYNDTVMFGYTVRNIEDKVVYANVTDTVVIGRLQPNRGVDFALRTLNEGSCATVILPSEEAYGVPGDGDRIGKRWILIYDLKINKITK
jgi:FKBP-type peptidyl-prolyl cis-trans isomerase